MNSAISFIEIKCYNLKRFKFAVNVTPGFSCYNPNTPVLYTKYSKRPEIV